MIDLDLLEETLAEGVYDPGIFKAIFLAGGPGSGKTFQGSRMIGVKTAKYKGTKNQPELLRFGAQDVQQISPQGVKIIASDIHFERNMRNADKGAEVGIEDADNLDDLPDPTPQNLTRGVARPVAGMSPGFDVMDPYAQMTLRPRAVASMKVQDKLYVANRLGILIDGTGGNQKKILKRKRELEALGYDCYMLFVNTTLKNAIKRDAARERKIGPKIVTSIWKDVQKNVPTFRAAFGDKFWEINTDDYAAADKVRPALAAAASKAVRMPPKNPIAQEWIRSQLNAKRRGSASRAVPGHPHGWAASGPEWGDPTSKIFDPSADDAKEYIVGPEGKIPIARSKGWASRARLAKRKRRASSRDAQKKARARKAKKMKNESLIESLVDDLLERSMYPKRYKTPMQDVHSDFGAGAGKLFSPGSRWNPHNFDRGIYVGNHREVKGPYFTPESAKMAMDPHSMTMLGWDGRRWIKV